jgi:hypothetical protein
MLGEVGGLPCAYPCCRAVFRPLPSALAYMNHTITFSTDEVNPVFARINLPYKVRVRALPECVSMHLCARKCSS